MTARVISNVFTHEHNRLAVAEQEYEAAKEHFREVLEHRVIGNPDHQARFQDSLERQDAARERYVQILTG